MADETNGKADFRAPPVAVEDISFPDQLAMMLRAFMASPLRNAIFWLAGGALAVIVATSLGQIILNRWNRPFYDAIERRDLDAFFHQLLVFAAIAGGLLMLGVMQTWLNQMMKLKLREGLTLDLINEWMRPRRAFRLANAGAIGVNPDQRMQEDAGHLTDLTTGLGFGLGNRPSCSSPLSGCCGRCHPDLSSTSAVIPSSFPATWYGPRLSTPVPPRC